MYKRIELDNGLRIIMNKMDSRRSIALGIWIGVGGRYESVKFKGISHFLEHMLFKGSSKYSCRQIKELIEGVGGSLNGFTSEEVTCYLVKSPSSYLKRAWSILSDMVMHPLIPKNDIDKERTVILEEIKMYKDLPQSYVFELLDNLLWPKQLLGMSVLGTEESVKSITRKELEAYKKQCYSPPGMVISLAGDFLQDEFIDMVNESFSRSKNSRTFSFVKAKDMQSKPQINIFQKPTEQTHLAIGFHGLKRSHPLKFALDLLHIILGANMSSRLFDELREKRGLAYEIGTQVRRFHDTGAFIVHAGIDNRKVPDAIAVIIKELYKIKTKLVNNRELRRAKDFYLGQLSLALEDTLEHMLFIGESTMALDKVYTYEEIAEEIEKIDAQKIQGVCRHLFRMDNINLALIGPVKDNHNKIQGLLNL